MIIKYVNAAYVPCANSAPKSNASNNTSCSKKVYFGLIWLGKELVQTMATQPRLCLKCAPGSLVAAQIKGNNTATWVRNAGRSDPVPTRFPQPSKARATRQNPAADLVLVFRINAQAPKTPLLWWAAMPRVLPLATESVDAATAYDIAHDIPNAGVVRVGPGGRVTIKLMTPQPYVEEGVQWPRHAHYVLPRADGVDAWDKSRVYTVAAWPGAHDAVVVHKLAPPRWLGMSEMRGFVSPEVVRACWKLPIARVCALAKSGVLRVTGARFDPNLDLRLSYDASDREVGELADHLAVLGIPAVVYCANSQCPAAAVLTHRLLATGRVANLFYMDAGLDGWYEHQT